MSTSTSQILNIDFDPKAPFPDSVFESSFGYMDSGLDYFQYPPSSPLGVPVGLPQSSPNMDYMPMNEYTYTSPYGPPSPQRPFTPAESSASSSSSTGVAPQTLSYPLSAGELSSDGMASGRISRGSGSHSPPAVSYAATVPRSHRFNPIAVPANRPSTRAAAAHKRTRSTRDHDDSDDDDDEEFKPGSIAGATDAPRDTRRETVRKQRIESEQRRRDELREGYSRLKEYLPASNQKASKVSLLDRATSHIRYLEAVKEQLEVRLKSADAEVARLRHVNEALMLGRIPGAPVPAAAYADCLPSMNPADITAPTKFS
ncbi:hypothetical protein JR316_0000406 [Psilocybe cubensis]|uniref:Uncharacterized protein n=2 Tax=Psilocybe cubensis TaxID=181762 RepID=A0ACB8HFB8_PSICU|nr:hypothetical protein JR316_0000406 [Psilocybe cubensis]KAH9486342.1 hypothetical protein JR316_0000406 [Psilocybe cubensis]